MIREGLKEKRQNYFFKEMKNKKNEEIKKRRIHHL